MLSSWSGLESSGDLPADFQSLIDRNRAFGDAHGQRVSLYSDHPFETAECSIHLRGFHQLFEVLPGNLVGRVEFEGFPVVLDNLIRVPLLPVGFRKTAIGV